MSFKPSKELEKVVRDLLKKYPSKRSASLMVLHAVQDEEGYISKEAVEWIAGKLDLQPINVYELVTFYPMFREEPAGDYHFKVCRTLSCALGGSKGLHKRLCERFKLNPDNNGLQVSPDGKFSIEWSECLASCGTPPVLMCNDDFFEAVDEDRCREIVEGCE